jgi:type II secretory pathway component PulK
MVSLWITAMLGVFAVGLGQRAAVTLRIARYQRDSLRARLLAEAGLYQAIALLEEDALDPETKDYDTVSACGLNLKGKEPKDVLSCSWSEKKESLRIGYGPADDFVHGLRDEESRINLNLQKGLFDRNKLIVLLELGEVIYPAELAGGIIDWLSASSTNALAKKESLRLPEELLLVLEAFFREKGNTAEAALQQAREAYVKLRDLFSVYGDENTNKLNINTASEKALRVLTRAIAKEGTGDESSADALAALIVSQRNQAPFKDKNAIDGASLGGSPDEQAIFSALKPYLVAKSDHYRIECEGRANNIARRITAVYNRDRKELLYWRESQGR